MQHPDALPRDRVHRSRNALLADSARTPRSRALTLRRQGDTIKLGARVLNTSVIPHTSQSATTGDEPGPRKSHPFFKDFRDARATPSIRNSYAFASMSLA